MAAPPRQVMAAAESASFEEEHLPPKRETRIWKPRKECLLKEISNVPDSESEEREFSDVSRNESDGSDPPAACAHVQPDLEDLDGEVSSTPEAVTVAELQTDSVCEVEDWDKELEDAERSPYDADDLYCGSFQENNLLVSYSWQEDWYYNPSCHHAPPLTFIPPVRVTEIGQFDADE